MKLNGRQQRLPFFLHTIMANKALSKRQKMVIRVEPSQKALKPRNPIALAAKQRVAGTHRKTVSAQRQLQERLLKKALGDDQEKS